MLGVVSAFLAGGYPRKGGAGDSGKKGGKGKSGRSGSFSEGGGGGAGTKITPGAATGGGFGANGIASTSAAAPSKARTARVLVCAPSNTAVDELVFRLTQPRGVLNGEGQPWAPTVYRLGKQTVQRAHAGGGWDIDRYTLELQADKLAHAHGGAKRKSLAEMRVKLLQEAQVVVCTLSCAGTHYLAKAVKVRWSADRMQGLNVNSTWPKVGLVVSPESRSERKQHVA